MPNITLATLHPQFLAKVFHQFLAKVKHHIKRRSNQLRIDKH